MKTIRVDEERTFEVMPCTHCGRDTIEYNPADEPWHDEQWFCDSCYSTFVIFNDEITKKIL